LNEHELNLTVNQTRTLVATVRDIMSSQQWTSSDPEVATVNGGYVRAISPGTATITVSVMNREHGAFVRYEDSCIVNVT